jgi:sulfate permease, SulP family
MTDGAATAHLYRPKLITAFQEGNVLPNLKHDALAGLTVAVVALPLSMAIAVASGVTPERGLFTAIVGGVIVSALGGSRYQIGGPAGAFIVLVSATAAQFGLQGLLTAVLMSGVMLTLFGALRLGSLVRHMPHAVTVGFTAAIAATIMASQLKDFGGLHLAAAEPGPILPKLQALFTALPTINPAALGVGVVTAAIIWGLKRWRPSWPGMLIAVVAVSAGAALLGLNVDTIGSRFGGIPRTLPAPAMPQLSWSNLTQLLPAAFSFTLLGAVESLLSAKVADGMTGRKHRSNMELVAQGIANIVSPLFGGICVTGTIARTATNIRAGARTPVAGILHSAFLLVFMIAAAPLAAYVPLAALAGVLVVVAWNMAEKAEFVRLCRDWRTAAVLLTTFGGTMLRDLTTGIIAGCVVAMIMWSLRRPIAQEGD